jgi:DNA-binding response OmpR family regulator
MQLPLILIIDDDDNLLFGLLAVMRREGYQWISANNGKDGLRLAQERLPDLIISDVMMPPPNGFELRKQLSINPKTIHIPFIFLTARAAQGDKIFGLEAGADDYITKPFDRGELVARVRAALRRNRVHLENER